MKWPYYRIDIPLSSTRPLREYDLLNGKNSAGKVIDGEGEEQRSIDSFNGITHIHRFVESINSDILTRIDP
jgi:hypothetical protein